MVMQALKTCIRSLLAQRGWRYRDLADALEVSEPTVKRWMTADDLSLRRVARIAAVFELTAFELLRRAEHGEEQSFTVSSDVEAALVEDPDALLAWDALRLGRPPAAVQDHYGHDDDQWFSLLGRLERLGLVERHPGGRVRVLHQGIHDWRLGGPLATHHRRLWQSWVQDAWDGTGPRAAIQAATRVVGPTFHAEATDELLQLARTWRDRAWRDQMALPPDRQKRVRWMLVLAEAPDWPELPDEC